VENAERSRAPYPIKKGPANRRALFEWIGATIYQSLAALLLAVIVPMAGSEIVLLTPIALSDAPLRLVDEHPVRCVTSSVRDEVDEDKHECRNAKYPSEYVFSHFSPLKLLDHRLAPIVGAAHDRAQSVANARRIECQERAGSVVGQKKIRTSLLNAVRPSFRRPGRLKRTAIWRV
jgi:hypothetical protein